MTITLPGSLLKLLGGENEYAQNDFIEDGKFKITQQQMKEFMFDPIVDQVLALIDGQLKRIPDVSSEKIKLFLVGGFGQSKYLEKRIREEFDDTNRVKMLFVPSDGGLSITRGAVLYGLNPDLITHRVCRRSYGVRCNRSFREGIDKEEYRIKGRDNKMRCKNRMDFFVNKNTQIKSSHFVERDYYAFYPDNPNSVLYAYDKDGNPPDYVTDDGIVKVSKLNIIMPEIPGKKSNEKIRYKTKIYLGLTEVKFEVDICGITRTYSANLDESEDSGSIQPKSQKKPNSPGFENIIAHFRKLGYNKTDRYKERAQIASEYIQKPKETGTVRRPPRDVRNKGKTKNTDNVATTSAPSTSQYLQPGEIAKMPEITEPA
jgi:hypothetical protein